MNTSAPMSTMENLLTHLSPGYVEILGSISVQAIYLLFGLIIESLRPAYKSLTTRKMITHSIRNHIVATLLHVAYVVSRNGKSVLTHTFITPYTYPSWTEIIRDLAIGLLLRDVVFWVIHRVWHLPGVYDMVHAKHHEVLEPGNYHVWTISYMSMVDFVFLYGAPVVLIVKMMEMNIVTTLLFAFVSAAGEQVKLGWGDERHDEHHKLKDVNFGTYGVVDWVCGTAGQAGEKEE
ncbi:fatty acid hydroxylase domain-containing protein 2 [Cercophora samala]|uniref:Fatty acid hydroxylase domain-containing protein 2 n=1 Tax=Cercophora samala TaxID=330535 RepID=A0AA40D8E4_9PEZI|nr:fatty acid hydroxylase domain-containing protein 2 [Cercophora samala]